MNEEEEEIKTTIITTTIEVEISLCIQKIILYILIWCEILQAGALWQDRTFIK
jgi:hypothetical protein